MIPQVQHLATLYMPSASEQARMLPDIGDVLSARLADLGRDPTSDGAQLVEVYLGDALRAVQRLRATLEQEQEVPDGITV